MADVNVIEKLSDLSDIERWKAEITFAKKSLDKFHRRAKDVNDRYLDEREAVNGGERWFNLFYANTGILQSSLYAQLPQPEVQRAHGDFKDQIGRVGANILQRCITPDADDPRDMFDFVLRQVVQDRLIAGLGTAWLRLETDTETVEVEPPMSFSEPDVMAPNSGFESGVSPDNPEELPQTYERITDQRVVLDYVNWEDFIWSPCRVWQERRWVGRRVYMTRDKLIERFGEDVGKQVPLTRVSQVALEHGPEYQVLQLAEVYEIWDRSSRKVVWVSMGYDNILDTKDDFLRLVGFDPCPTPLFANTTTRSTVPRPDFYMFQDQYSELDTVNNRISLLIQAIRVAGLYDSAAEGIDRLLTSGAENVLIPVDSWAAFAEKGGMKGAVDWLPLETIERVLTRLYEARNLIKEQIYELTGISDIVRGTSKASETLGAQQLKAQFASVRINKLQEDVAKFASELLRLKAEIIVKHFDPEVLLRHSNILRTPDAQLAPIAIGMLKSEEGFEWRIKVTPDQLAQADYALQKQDRVELLTAVGQYMSQIKDVLTMTPQLLPLFVELLKWAVSGFKGARDVEGLIEQELNKLLAPPQGGQGDQDPEKEQQQQEAQLNMAGKQMDLQQKQQSYQMDQQAKILDIQHKKATNTLDLISRVQKIGL